ncbi:hypothetical protein [Devosia sediminis]|uniref:Uncharacterized protein n=1 Tax=Devosia sediminis TaxID=2798801 RepID=A0A934MJS6_9HYPH|nr:hypothetical protein [Devosia sediminis]MBJ3783390.1 hypothetical protein [Devosia sediminis]
MSERIVVTIRAELQYGSSRVQEVNRQITATTDEAAEEIRAVVTEGLRQINVKLKELIR